MLGTSSGGGLGGRLAGVPHFDRELWPGDCESIVWDEFFRVP